MQQVAKCLLLQLEPCTDRYFAVMSMVQGWLGQDRGTGVPGNLGGWVGWGVGGGTEL